MIATVLGARVIRKLSSERVYVVFYVLLVPVGMKLTWDGAAALSIGRTS